MFDYNEVRERISSRYPNVPTEKEAMKMSYISMRDLTSTLLKLGIFTESNLLNMRAYVFKLLCGEY